MRIALLHIAPVTGDLDHNRRLVEQGVAAAAEAGAQWAITPELCIPGYLFLKSIGTGWIQPQPDQWMTNFCRTVRRRRITVFLSHPERDPASGRMYNTVFVINPEGEIIGRHRKIKTLGGRRSLVHPRMENHPLPMQRRPNRNPDLRRRLPQRRSRSPGKQGNANPGVIRILGPRSLRTRRRMGSPLRRHRPPRNSLQPHRHRIRRNGLPSSRKRSSPPRPPPITSHLNPIRNPNLRLEYEQYDANIRRFRPHLPIASFRLCCLLLGSSPP